MINFIEYLKGLDTTQEVVYALFNYFKDNVTYIYDDLQAAKYSVYLEKFDKVNKMKSLISKNGVSVCSKEELVKLLDEVFMEIEGRPLSDRNKIEWFKNYGKIYHQEATPASNGLLKKSCTTC